jgi:putative ABC transport system permease protein
MIGRIAGDVRQATRTIIAHPWFSLVIVLTLALGVGANAAIFSVVDALLLRPLPFRDPERLVHIGSVLGGDEGAVMFAEWRDVSGLTEVFEDVAAYTDLGQYNASGDGPPEELPSTITSHNLFHVLGSDLTVGRTWPAAYDSSRHFSLVISDGLWTRRFGRDPNVISRTMTLDGAEGYEIVGVAPPGLTFPSNSALFRSIGINPDPTFYTRRTTRYVWLVARLRGGVSYAQAQGALDRLAAQLERTYPASNTGIRFRLTPLRDLYVGGVRPYVLLLAGGVALVLLLACANVANLLLSRAIGRQRDLAVRSALGATRGDLVRQMSAEITVIAALGALAGVGVAAGALRLLTTVVDLRLPHWMAIGLDWRTMTFLGGAAATTAVLTGLLPAIRLSRPDIVTDLKESARGSTAGAQQRVRHALVVAEVAVATLLLVGAALMVQTVRHLQRVDLGFAAERGLTFRVELGWRAYDSLAKSERFYTTVLDRLASRAEVESVAFDSNLPLSGKPREPIRVVVAGQSSDEQNANPFVNAHWISPGLFSTMRMPIVAGRAFTDDDREHTAGVAIINQRMAERLFPGQSPLGRQLRAATSATSAWKTIVGVVGNVGHQDVTAGPALDMYLPYRQSNVSGVYFVVRGRSSTPHGVAPALSSIIWGIDPNQSFFDVRPLEDRVAAVVRHQRAVGWLFGAFAALALILAASGLYAVLSYAVSRQTRELAVRIALGAAQRNVVGLVLSRTLLLVLAGVGIGLLSAAAIARTIGGLLFGIAATDLRTFVAVPLLLAGVAVIAAYLPVRRATRVDPLIALRTE